MPVDFIKMAKRKGLLGMTIEPTSSEVSLSGYAEQELLKTLHESTEDLIVVAAQMIVGIRNTNTDNVEHVFRGLNIELRYKIVNAIDTLLKKSLSELNSLSIDEEEALEFARLSACLKEGDNWGYVLYLYLSGRCSMSYMFNRYELLAKRYPQMNVNDGLIFVRLHGEVDVRGKDKDAVKLYNAYALGRLHSEDK